MSSISPDLVVGQSVAHAEMGVGVFVGLGAEGYARVFFQRHGERQVPLTTLVQEQSWEEQVVANVRSRHTGCSSAALARGRGRAVAAAGERRIPDRRQSRSAAAPDRPHLSDCQRLAASVSRCRQRGPRQNHRDRIDSSRTGLARRIDPCANGRTGWACGELAARTERYLPSRLRGLRVRRRRDRPQEQCVRQA